MHYFRTKATLFPTSFSPNHGQIGGGLRSEGSEDLSEVMSVGRLQNLASHETTAVLQRFDKEAIFGGYSIAQFGHFIVESLGRLPIASEHLTNTPIVFLSGGRRSARLHGWQRQLLWEFGIKNNITILDRSTYFPNLIIPDLHFHLDLKPFGDAAGKRWLQSRFPAKRQDRNLKLYVSRSRLEPRLGKYVEEPEIEQCLEKAGYTIIHPQEFSISEQIGLYRSAAKIVAAESSALHLIGLACSEGQEVLVVQRRPKLHRSLVRPIRFSARATICSVDAIDRFFAPNSSNANFYRGVSSLNLSRLWKAFSIAGFIREGEANAFRSEAASKRSLELMRGLQELEMKEGREVLKQIV